MAGKFIMPCIWKKRPLKFTVRDSNPLKICKEVPLKQFLQKSWLSHKCYMYSKKKKGGGGKNWLERFVSAAKSCYRDNIYVSLCFWQYYYYARFPLHPPPQHGLGLYTIIDFLTMEWQWWCITLRKWSNGNIMSKFMK